MVESVVGSINKLVFESVIKKRKKKKYVPEIPGWQTAGKILAFRHVTFQILGGFGCKNAM